MKNYSPPGLTQPSFGRAGYLRSFGFSKCQGQIEAAVRIALSTDLLAFGVTAISLGWPCDLWAETSPNY